MQNKLPAASASTAVGHPVSPPIPADYSATISAVSLLVAVAATIVSTVSLRRSARVERGSKFENSYGSHLREELRKFERLTLKFRAFTFPFNKELSALKEEFDTFRVEVEENTQSLICVLAEIDKSPADKQHDWTKTLTASTERAELLMQSVAHPNVASEIDFRAKAEKARESYQLGIDAVRQKLAKTRF